MALSNTSGLAGGPGWLFDDTSGDLTPVTGGSYPLDAVRGVGRQSANALGSSTAGAARALVNQFLPGSVAMVQTVPGAEANTFTSRQAIQGTLVNAFNLAASQTAGTFPANALNVLGRTIRICGGGTWGVTATPNFTLDVSFGATVVATTTAFATSAVTSPQNFTFAVLCQVTTVGASGAIQSTGTFTGQITALTSFPAAMANSTPGTAAVVDLTATQALSVGATWSVSNAANRIRLFALSVEVLY